MLLNRSLGGIGKLYRDDSLLGEVYYNIRQDQPPDSLDCSIVFVGNDVDLPNDNGRYRLFLEDGRYLLVTIKKVRPVSPTPYIGTSADGVFHTQLLYSRS